MHVSSRFWNFCTEFIFLNQHQVLCFLWALDNNSLRFINWNHWHFHCGIGHVAFTKVPLEVLILRDAGLRQHWPSWSSETLNNLFNRRFQNMFWVEVTFYLLPLTWFYSLIDIWFLPHDKLLDTCGRIVVCEIASIFGNFGSHHVELYTFTWMSGGLIKLGKLTFGSLWGILWIEIYLRRRRVMCSNFEQIMALKACRFLLLIAVSQLHA